MVSGSSVMERTCDIAFKAVRILSMQMTFPVWPF